jgi:hypothetical protein
MYNENAEEQRVVEMQPPAPPEPVDYSRMIHSLSVWKGILNARLLALLALCGSLVGFGFCMYNPDPVRLWGLAIYAILCQAPILALYLRKG